MQYAILKQLKVHILFTVSTPPQDARAQMKRKMSTFLLSGVLITYNYKTELFSLTLS